LFNSSSNSSIAFKASAGFIHWAQFVESSVTLINVQFIDRLKIQNAVNLTAKLGGGASSNNRFSNI